MSLFRIGMVTQISPSLLLRTICFLSGRSRVKSFSRAIWTAFRSFGAPILIFVQQMATNFLSVHTSSCCLRWPRQANVGFVGNWRARQQLSTG